LAYSERLKRANLSSLELRRLHFDLVWCYKVLFGHVDMKLENFCEWAPPLSTTGHKYKLYKKRSSVSVRYHFFLNVSSTYHGIHYLMKLILVQLKVLHVLLNVSRLIILSAISNVIMFSFMHCFYYVNLRVLLCT